MSAHSASKFTKRAKSRRDPLAPDTGIFQTKDIANALRKKLREMGQPCKQWCAKSHDQAKTRR